MKQNVLQAGTAMIVNTSAGVTIILRATHKPVNVFATKAGPGKIAPNRAQKDSTDWAVRKDVRISFMAIRRVIMSAVIMYVGQVTLGSRVNIHVPMVNTVCIAVKIAHVKMVQNAITLVDPVNVHQAGWEQIVMFLVRTALMVQIAVKIVNAKIMLDAVKTTATASVIQAGWEPIAMMFAQKVSMVNTVWNSVNVHHRISHVMRLMDVNAGKVLAEMIVLRHCSVCWRLNDVSHI